MIEPLIIVVAFVIGVGFAQEVAVPAGEAFIDTSVELYQKAEDKVKSYTAD